MGQKWEVQHCLFSSSWIEEYVLVGSVAPLLANQLEDTNHHIKAAQINWEISVSVADAPS